MKKKSKKNLKKFNLKKNRKKNIKLLLKMHYLRVLKLTLNNKNLIKIVRKSKIFLILI